MKNPSRIKILENKKYKNGLLFKPGKIINTYS